MIVQKKVNHNNIEQCYYISGNGGTVRSLGLQPCLFRVWSVYCRDGALLDIALSLLSFLHANERRANIVQRNG